MKKEKIIFPKCRNEDLVKILNEVTYDSDSLNYIDDNFYQSKELLKEFLENNIYNIKINYNEFLICNNITGLILDLIKHLENETDLFLIENPSYYIFNDLLKDKETEYIKMNEDGIDLENLETILSDVNNRKKRILLIIVPYHQNPTCINYSLEKKEAIIELSNRYKNLTIISDEVYSLLSINEKENLLDQPLFYMDKNKNSNIISVNSFSKSFIPSLKYGWIFANKDIIKLLNHDLIFKVSHFDIHIYNKILERGDLNYLIIQNNKLNTNLYEHQSKILKNQLSDYLEIKSKIGIYFWCKIKNKINISNFIKKCKENNLNITDGRIFFYNKQKDDEDYYVRINLHNSNHEFENDMIEIKEIFKNLI